MSIGMECVAHDLVDDSESLVGLELSAAERLAWLETTMKELRPLVGRAADPASSSPEARDTSGTVLSGEA